MNTITCKRCGYTYDANINTSDSSCPKCSMSNNNINDLPAIEAVDSIESICDAVPCIESLISDFKK